MTMYNEPEFKVVVARTEDVLTASPIFEASGNPIDPSHKTDETDIMPLFINING